MFTYQGVENFLRRAKDQIEIFPLRDWIGQSGMILRHDVDLDIQPAWKLAQVEQRIDVKSTFFILVTCETYNASSSSSRKMLREMRSEGFEIGLHFDPSIYPEADHEAMEQHARDEANYLAEIVGSEVNSISLHNPDHYGRIPLFDSFKNAYDARIFSNEQYSSDSRMVFRTPPDSLLTVGKTKIVQLNLHPEHYSEAGQPYPHMMVAYIERMIGRVHEMFGVNAPYLDAVGVDLHGHVREHLSSTEKN